MKKLILSNGFILLLALTANFSCAQGPEKVYSVVKEIHPFEWYSTQAEGWKKVLDKDPKNAPAWLYFYTANRMMWLTERDRWEKLQEPWIKSPTEIVAMAQKAVPGTFEAVYLKVWNDPEDPNHEKNLMTAYQLSQGRAEILDEMAMFYEIRRNMEKRKEINGNWFQSNEIPEGLLNYNYNVLMTLPEDGIIMTQGDNDTFPLWVLQDALGIRTGVAVLNINLLMMNDYRARIFRELGISDISFNSSDYKNQDTVEVLKQLIIGQILENAKRPVYIALTVDRTYYSDNRIMNDLYLEGLAMRYQKKGYDNLGVIRRHYEQDYLLDYLRESFRYDASKTVTARMNTGYLPSLIKLCNHYKSSDESRRLETIRQMILNITRSSGNQEDFMTIEPYINCN